MICELAADRIRPYDESGRPTIAVDISHRDIYDTETNIFGVGVSLSPGGRRNSQLQGRYELAGESVVPSEVSEITYTYGPDGAPIQFESPQIVGESAITNTYEASTGRLSTQSGPGFVTDLGYDQAGQVAESTTTLVRSGAIGSQTRNDPAGNVTSRGGSTYTYDALGRMVSAHDGETGDDYDYAYDLASNRTKVTKHAATSQELTFTVADKIDTTQNPQFAYDAAGRLISDTTSVGDKRHYIWDGHGRLKGIDVYHDESGHYDNVRFTYDLVGRLAEKTTYLDLTYPADHLFYHYDGDRLIFEEDMTGTVREYLYAGGGAPTAMRARQSDGSYKNFFFVANTHGDVVAVTDKDGNIVNRYAYGPWGEATRVSEQVHQPFRYAGYRYEDGFDLYWLSSRWYDSGTARFISRDQFRGLRRVLPSLNKYAYTWGNAATFVDPSGYSPRRPQGKSVPGVYPGCSGGSSSGSTFDYLTGVVGAPCDFGTYVSPQYDPDYKDTDAGWRMLKPPWAGDACSYPATETGPYWNFWDACGTHDYGYDLVRYGHRAGHVLVSKGDVDDLFFLDMSAHCDKRGLLTKQQCRAVAAAYYTAVRNNGSEPR